MNTALNSAKIDSMISTINIMQSPNLTVRKRNKDHDQ